ncbi:immunity 70 family protein [Sphingobium sp. MK2]|uniref:immunity 70 family protein n=1 Tax=Sphingobium sp. MK2 TaxID=3116540 RepID=UPI0032E35985
MAVGIKLGSITDEIGTSDFFNAFFSTIAGNLEPKGWGTRFPALMNKLYAGELAQSDAGTALHELDQVGRELTSLPASKVIWDIEDRGKIPPWGDNIADTITDLSNYFVTSTGRDLISTLREVLEELRDNGGVAQVVSY